MSKNKVNVLLDSLTRSLGLSPRTVMATIFGDMLVSYRCTVWLSSLVQLAELFGINESLARTSALRLSYDGWLTTTKMGKYSYYSLTPEHAGRVLDYHPRVYREPQQDWSGVWYVLLAGVIDNDKSGYKSLRQELLWMGAGQIAPYVFLMAENDLRDLKGTLTKQDLLSKVQVLKATAAFRQDPHLMKDLASKAWNIDELKNEYEKFLADFRPIWRMIESSTSDLEPQQAFRIRALLISEYRRLCLRDPGLPTDLLPSPWSGYSAFQLCRSIYSRVLFKSEEFLAENVRTADGALSATPDEVFDRFGGLQIKRRG